MRPSQNASKSCHALSVFATALSTAMTRSTMPLYGVLSKDTFQHSWNRQRRCCPRETTKPSRVIQNRYNGMFPCLLGADPTVDGLIKPDVELDFRCVVADSVASP